MIFCTRCGRYFKDETVTCGMCGADLNVAGHRSFQGTTIKVSPVPNISSPAIPAASEQRGSDSMPESGLNSLFDRDKFLLRQKALAIKEKYYVTDEHGEPIVFVERPALLTQQLIMLAGVAAAFFGGSWVVRFLARLSGETVVDTAAGVISIAGFFGVLVLTAYTFVWLVPKRHVTFYTDDRKTETLLEIKQLNKVEFPNANFEIHDASGNLIGKLRKNVLFDYIRRRWSVMNKHGLELCKVKEDSLILSLLRRTGIPIFAFMRTNFIFLRGDDVVGEFNRKFTIFDRYVLDMSADPSRAIDRRIALAIGVMLDTGERR